VPQAPTREGQRFQSAQPVARLHAEVEQSDLDVAATSSAGDVAPFRGVRNSLEGFRK
jgi:hypothetical protein